MSNSRSVCLKHRYGSGVLSPGREFQWRFPRIVLCFSVGSELEERLHRSFVALFRSNMQRSLALRGSRFDIHADAAKESCHCAFVAISGAMEWRHLFGCNASEPDTFVHKKLS